MIFMNKKTIAAFALFLLLCSPTTGKTQEQSMWENLGLYGGQIAALDIDPEDSSVLYAGSWGGDGMFKSTDSGETWVSLSSDNSSLFRNYEIFDIAVDPKNKTTR